MCVVECELALSITSARVPLRARVAVSGWRRYLLAAHVQAFAGLCRNVRLTVKATKRGSFASEYDAHDWFFHVVVQCNFNCLPHQHHGDSLGGELGLLQHAVVVDHAASRTRVSCRSSPLLLYRVAAAATRFGPRVGPTLPKQSHDDD
jgi:hypothetical protein